VNFKALGADLGLEEDEFRELMELFVETEKRDLQLLANGLEASDIDQITRCAHTIKGASGNLGLAEFSAVADTIEQHALNHRLEEAAQAFAALKQQFDAIQSLMDA
jgi:histidine phosphotransfer protein HptB